MLYILNLYSVVYQLYLNKTGGKKEKENFIPVPEKDFLSSKY